MCWDNAKLSSAQPRVRRLFLGSYHRWPIPGPTQYYLGWYRIIPYQLRCLVTIMGLWYTLLCSLYNNKHVLYCKGKLLSNRGNYVQYLCKSYEEELSVSEWYSWKRQLFSILLHPVFIGLRRGTTSILSHTRILINITLISVPNNRLLTKYELFSPPLSAIFSPNVCLPLTYM